MKQEGKRSKKKINYLRLCIFIISVVVLVIIGVYIKNIVSLHIEHNNLINEQKDLEQKKRKLQEELKNVDDLDYIEEQARKQLRMVRPGEVLYILDDKNGKQENK